MRREPIIIRSCDMLDDFSLHDLFRKIDRRVDDVIRELGVSPSCVSSLGPTYSDFVSFCESKEIDPWQAYIMAQTWKLLTAHKARNDEAELRQSQPRQKNILRKVAGFFLP